MRVSHLYARTLVLSISGWCSSTGAALSVRSSGHIGHGCFYQPAKTVTWEGDAKVIPQPWSSSGWEVVMEEGTRSRRKQKEPLLQRCRAKEADVIRFEPWHLQVVTVCPSAAEELCMVNVVGIQCLFLVSSSRNPGGAGGTGLLAIVCSSGDPSRREFSQAVPCKESVRWLYVIVLLSLTSTCGC